MGALGGWGGLRTTLNYMIDLHALPLTVLQILNHSGRTAHVRMYDRPTCIDYMIVLHALSLMMVSQSLREDCARPAPQDFCMARFSRPSHASRRWTGRPHRSGRCGLGSHRTYIRHPARLSPPALPPSSHRGPPAPAAAELPRPVARTPLRVIARLQ